MAIDFLYPQYEVVRNNDRCINCRACERQCANEVHFWDADNNRMQADESKCVACHRCVALCPTRALKIVKTDHTFRENANWTGKAISEVYRQAGSGGVLLSSMGNRTRTPSTGIKSSSTLRRLPIRPSTRCASRWRPRPSSAKSRARSSATRTATSFPTWRRSWSSTCRSCSPQ